MATLPFEQRAQIAQDLHDDSDSLSLKSLSQVSFQWRVPAQMYLFQNLHISIIKQRNARDFLHFLQASPHLLPFVRTLGLYQRGSSYVSVTEITAITSTLPNLRNLELYAYLTIVAGDEGAQEDALTINCGLTLMRVYLNEEAFTMLLAFFRGPQLLVNSVFLTNFTTDTRVSLDLSNYSSLRRVHVGEVAKLGGLDDESVVPIRDILVSICPQTLKAFGMVCDVSYTTDVRLVNKYLGSKGHCVEDLQLDFASDAEVGTDDLINFIGEETDTADEGYGTLPVDWHPIRLSQHCPSLKIFSFALVIVAEMPGDDNFASSAILHWRFALRVLASAPSTITTIRIGLLGQAVSTSPEFLDFRTSTMGRVDWAKWDMVLSGFELLEKVEFFKMEETQWDGRFRDPMEPRAPLSQGFVQDMARSLGENMSERNMGLFCFV